MKAHIARNQNAGIPLALGWNLSAADPPPTPRRLMPPAHKRG